VRQSDAVAATVCCSVAIGFLAGTFINLAGKTDRGDLPPVASHFEVRIHVVVETNTHYKKLWEEAMRVVDDCVATPPKNNPVKLVLMGDGVPENPCDNGRLYGRRDGKKGSSLYICEEGNWRPVK